ncbi:MAG: PIG-L family deacetylase [Bacteroidetes bacterium SB0662_bin_6]|nr:PIG-L family deacetylase [Bacteroidetes bacterium SB0668_bin_1]MYE04691.1 PIG-L family deacetylase [Bacteroidetes bacterium SB0662_bin_6]
MRFFHSSCSISLLAAFVFILTAHPATGQSAPDRVLAFPSPVSGEVLPSDQGAPGAWHRINKLGTTASLLHVLAHPDDEHAGMLALSSRAWGARTSELSINRGEAGANAIGSELFDALGLIRTRELVLSGRYYGLDDLYFTRAVDYGYSKTLDEAMSSWDPEVVLEDIVRVIRLNRPIAVVSRFYAGLRDGHGHHQASGVLTPQAVAAAADPNRFPEQISEEGLRSWSVPLLFRGGAADDEPHHVVLDATAYSPLLGVSYGDYGRYGLSLQRSQTSGRFRNWGGRTYRYELLGDSASDAENRVSDTFFEGIDTSLPGFPALVGEEASLEVASSLAELQTLIDGVMQDFDFLAPEQVVSELVRGLGLVRSTIEAAADLPETAFELSVKAQQFEDAIIAAAGVRIRAELADQALGASLVRNQEAAIAVAVESELPDRIAVREVLVLERDKGGVAELARSDEGAGNEVELVARVGSGDPLFDGPYFERSSPTENMYRILEPSSAMHLPWRPMALSVQVLLEVDGVEIVRTMPVTGYVSRLPFGFLARRVEILPDLSVSISPRVHVLPMDMEDIGAVEAVPVLVRVEAIADSVVADIAIELPEGWTSDPASIQHAFGNQGEVVEARFMVQPPADWSGEATIQAMAESGEGEDRRQYRNGYQVIEHRDLPLARLRMPAEITILSVPVARLDGMQVGYVMGVGDEVPAAIENLGASVQLLGEGDLASGSLDHFDTIVVGTRAYAVRQDLVEHNRRLLDYAAAGGNLIILYQTQEFVPNDMAAHPAELPRGAQEVSEQDSPVRILAPDHPLLTTPNAITLADFDHWIEQRGSKFFTEWDAAYTPLVETQDTGQAPQQGIWLASEVGSGHYSYLSLALHRQVPYGVPGAFRILSNAIALGGR